MHAYTYLHVFTGKYIKCPSRDMADSSNKKGGEHVEGRLCTVCPIVSLILTHVNAFPIFQMHEE